MVSPLDEFANSPRRFRNDDGSEVVASSLVKLGSGIIASRPSGAPGEATFVTLDAPGVASQAAQIAALTARVTALEAKQMVAVEAFGQTSIAADPYTIVFVNFDDGIGPSDITVNLPTPTAELANAQIRVVDISADGGVSAGQALKLTGTFAPAVGGGYATSPYVVGDNGFGQSRRGAWIDVVCLGTAGWRITAEGTQPMAP